MTQRDYETTTGTNVRSTGDNALMRDRTYDTESGKSFRRVLSAGTLAGDRVRNSAGEDLGKIEELMIDVPSGRVAYAVLSFGGFLGMGNKLFAVPWNALSLDEREHEFVLNVEKQVLENAPGFDKDNWPDMADPAWGSQIYAHYGRSADWDTGTEVRNDIRDDVRAGTTRPRGKTLTGGGGV